MSDVSQGPGWWQASDGKWYPPEAAPAAATPPPGPTGPPPAGPPSGFGPPSGPPAGFGGPPGPGAAPAYGAPAFGGPAAGAPGQLAEWPQRALAGLIDFVAIGVIANIVSFSISSALGFLLSLVGLAFALYNAYLNGETGQSIGKKVVGLKVVGEATGQPIGGGQGIVRYLAHIPDAIICGLGFLLPLADAKKQTIGDKIMKTVVLTGEPKQAFGDAIKPS